MNTKKEKHFLGHCDFLEDEWYIVASSLQ